MEKKFYSKAAVEAYLRSKGDNVEVKDEPRYRPDEKSLYEQCKQIPGCKVGLVWVGGPYINLPEPFICWKGTEMRFSGFFQAQKTRELTLLDTLDTKGYCIHERMEKDAPNKIGVPTAKKLDEWREYLLKSRKVNDERVAQTCREAENKKAQCKAMFPDGKERQFNCDKEWEFEYNHAGLKYICHINHEGYIREDLDLTYTGYKEDVLIKAFLMMQNPYTPMQKAV